MLHVIFWWFACALHRKQLSYSEVLGDKHLLIRRTPPSCLPLPIPRDLVLATATCENDCLLCRRPEHVSMTGNIRRADPEPGP